MRVGGGDDTSLSIPFNIASTFKIMLTFRILKKKGNEDREKTKVDNKQKQISLTVFQMDTIATLKGGYIQKN